MDWRSHLLHQCGYQILDVSGDYCLAFREDKEFIFRWDGAQWLIL